MFHHYTARSKSNQRRLQEENDRGLLPSSVYYTHKLQLYPIEHRASAEAEGDDARYDDEAVKQHGQDYAPGR